MQQEDCNAPATMVRAMNEIFKDIIYKDLIIYKDPIIYIDHIIISRTYHQHVATFRKVLQRLVDQQSWLKGSKCQLFTKRLEIRTHPDTGRILCRPIKGEEDI